MTQVFTHIYSFSYCFPLWLITGYWVLFPVLYRRTFVVGICFKLKEFEKWLWHQGLSDRPLKRAHDPGAPWRKGASMFPKTPNVRSFAQSSPTLCHPLDCVACQAPLSMGFFRQEYWSGLPFSSFQGSSQPRDQTRVSCISCVADELFTYWAVKTPGDIWNKRFCQVSPSPLPLPHILLSCHLFHDFVLFIKHSIKKCSDFTTLFGFHFLMKALCHVKLISNKSVLLACLALAENWTGQRKKDFSPTPQQRKLAFSKKVNIFSSTAPELLRNTFYF